MKAFRMSVAQGFAVMSMRRSCQSTLRYASTSAAPTGGISPVSTTIGSSPGPVSFCLKALPVQLQREFDLAENRITLQHLLASHTARLHSDNSESSSIDVKPTWMHLVSWRCGRCHGGWDARPADRLNPQTADQHACPHCALMRSEKVAPSALHTLAPENTKERQRKPDSRSAFHLEDDYKDAAAEPVARSLLEAYPVLAAQWNVTLNAVPSNRVAGSVSTVPVTSRMQTWWSCPLCSRAWRETVASRVAQTEKGIQQYGEDFIPLCASCEGRGAQRRVQTQSPSSSTRAPKRVLADDPALLAEARLRPDQDPALISLTAESILSWSCRFCQHDFQASVANRFLRYERCPQCTGKARTPYNLLVIQRPDVLREVAKTISRTALSYVTVHDRKELPFVCRTCFSHYRMSARTRCALPPGSIACPKCLLNACHITTQLATQSHSSDGQQPIPDTQRAGKPRRRQGPRWRAKKLVTRAGRRERSGETLRITRNELRMRDHSLRD